MKKSIRVSQFDQFADLFSVILYGKSENTGDQILAIIIRKYINLVIKYHQMC